MSSGEADAAAATRRMLERSTSLDAFTKCTGDMGGCHVMVHLSSGIARCHLHGGDPSVPEYMTSSSDAALVHARHLSLDLGGDCE